MANSDSYGTIDSAAEFLTRRKMLAATSAMVTGGLAGCLGEDDSDGNGSGGQILRTFTQAIPTEMNFNTWASSYPWTPTWILLEPVTKLYADGSVTLELIDDWEYDEETQETTVHHNEDFYWWNGDVCNAADKYYYGEVARLLNPESSNYEQLTLENDGGTIVREYKEPQNPQLVEYDLGGYLGAMMRGHRESFRQWAEELEDASSEDERTEIEERMAEEMPLNIETVMEDGLGMGPFEIVDYDEEGIYCELYDEHPYADQINVDEFEYVLAEDQAIAQQITSGDLHFGYNQLADWVGDQDVSGVETVTTFEDTFMRKFEFMMQGGAAEHLRKLEVRRAIMHLIDLENVSNNFSPPSTPRSRQTGLPGTVTEDRLGDYADDFIDYPVAADEEGATELMESAGYERDDGNWVDEDGDPISFEFVVQSWGDNPARTITSQFDEFGFESNLTPLEGAAYNDRTEDSVDFDLTLFNHGATVAHPQYYFRSTHKAGNDLGDANVIEGALEDGETHSPYNGKELIVEIPTEVGQEDLSGETEDINLHELHQEWLTAQTDEENREIAETFTWFWNFYLPGIDLFEEESGSWGNTDMWEFDINEEWEAYLGSFRAAKRGYISPN